MHGTESVDLVGIIGLILLGFFLYGIWYLIHRSTKPDCQKADLVWDIEEMVIKQVAKKKGFDIEKMHFQKESKTFKKRLEEQMVEEFFGKDKDKK